MPILGLLPCLLAFALGPVWNLLMPASCHPQHSTCRLASKTALCNGCQLSAVPKDLPGNIEELQLSNNHIRILQNNCLSGYPVLRVLRCASSLLDTIESDVFLGSCHIEILNLAENNLHAGYQQTGQALQTLSRLRTLDLSANGLTEDMVSVLLENMTSLESLSLSRNILLRLDEATFRDLCQLKELNLERNLLFEIDGAFDNLQKLQRLNLAYNGLPCLVGFQLTQLVELNASNNMIEWFISNQDVEETFNLETLDLSNNNLLFFPFLPTRSRIQKLLLSNNRMSFYEHLADNTSPNWTTSVQFFNLMGNVTNVTAKLWDETLHGGISTLNLLDLTGNQVGYLPQGFLNKMPSLSRLKLRTNCLESLEISPEELPTSLYELDVSNNRLTELQANLSSLRELSNLTNLNLSLNSLQSLPPRLFSNLPSLNTVDLSYNSVGICSAGDSFAPSLSDCVVWRNIASLRQLYLAGCNLTHLPPSAFERTSITHLDLSNNPEIRIGQGALTDLSRTLQHLGLGRTGLQDFDFTPFRHLKSLYFSSNSITRLPQSLLSLDLTLLDLRDNRLTTIPSQQSSTLAQTVQTLFLGGNPFNCCQLEWYRTLEEAKTVNIEDQADVTCLHFTHGRHRVELLRGPVCGDDSAELSWLYIVLLLSACLSLVGIAAIFMLTFRPRLLPKAIKKKCWRPTSY
ncbi:transforming growth factor beta activator LRRC33 [Megalops cyprinoides]|uniref:transforming growth factor beta activator LRRC33 n=1 Tax=Megalops cyprinoides TaxID=118141 RepID=UPI00186532ED|nr:transforming growth factor beta activator LRRC33 [Megalops cyprinoides]